MRWKPPRKYVLFALIASFGGVLVCAIPMLVYFPGRQTPIAFTLATGIGISRTQARVDRLSEKAINRETFTDNERTFLKNLYTCFAKGGRLLPNVRQTAAMMDRYLSCSGADLKTAPRIFIISRPVKEQMETMKSAIRKDCQRSGEMKEVYSSETFYMCDPAFPDSNAGLYFGRLLVRPQKTGENKLRLEWRAECPWEWPSYQSLFERYGRYHAERFSLPNARSALFGRKHSLQIDDGLGAHLAVLGLAKPFLVYSEWTEEIEPMGAKR